MKPYYETENGKLFCNDNVSYLNTVEDNTFDLTITSPPYDNLRDYKGYSWNFKSLAKELYRTTKQGGVVVWVVGDATIKGSETGSSFRQALYFMECGFNLHDTMIYVKDPRFPRKNGYGNSFDYMFVFSKKTIGKFNPIMRKTLNKRYNKLITNRQKDGTLKAKRYNSPDKSPLYNVWYYSSGYMKSTKDRGAYSHPAIFPEQLASDHIISWSNQNDLVFDPFMGSGTTAKMCEKANRKWIGCEIAEKYCKIAKNRIQKERTQTKLF